MHIDYHERNAREFVPRRRSIQYMQLIVRVLIKNSYSYASFLSEPISCSKQFFNDWAVNRPGYFSRGARNSYRIQCILLPEAADLYIY